MTVPLLLLSLGAIFSGYIGAALLGIVDADLAFWRGSIVMLGQENILEEAHHVPLWVKLSPLVVGAIGLIVAYLCYIRFTSLPGFFEKAFRPLYLFSHNKWYIDELYDFLFVNPAKRLGYALWQWVDIRTIDRFGPNGLATVSQRIAVFLSRCQTGFFYHYAFVMLIGLTAIISWYLYFR